MRRVIRLAQQTFLALKNPYHSVEHVYPQAIRAAERFEQVRYVGVKNVAPIPSELLRILRKHGYELHTLDRCSVNGRAVDMMLKNPLTGRPMTGSSSGTAINVFTGINDLGIGTDGGGSVLAPAMSLQCYGFISPLLRREHMKKYEKKSTDGLCFTPSLGFIARELEVIREAAQAGLGISLKREEDSENRRDTVVICPDSLREQLKGWLGGEELREQTTGNMQQETEAGLTGKTKQAAEAEAGPTHETPWERAAGAAHETQPSPAIRLETVPFPPLDNEREPLIAFLRQQLPQWDVVVHYEKRIDVDGLGDTILGHFDRETQADQAKSGKYFIRVANMAGATALCIPDSSLASGWVLMCESEPEKIRRLFEVAGRFPAVKDELLERYFRNMDAYFPDGFLEAGIYES